MELKNKGVDAIINDSPVVGYYLAQGGNTSMKTVGDIMEAEQYGLAVKKGNDKLAGEINKALAELKKNGEYDKIYKTWFGEVKKLYFVHYGARQGLIAGRAPFDIKKLEKKK